MASQFRFESLLKIRKATQDEKKEEFLVAQSRLQAARDELETLEKRLQDVQNDARATRSGGALDAAALRRFQTFRAALVERRDAAAEIVRIRRDDAESRRRELNNAIRETKILQKLKDKQEAERLDAERRRAQKNADEAAARQKIFERQKEKRDADNLF